MAFLAIEVVVTNFDKNSPGRLGRDNALKFLIDLSRDFVSGVDSFFPAIVAHSEQGQNEKGAQHNSAYQEAKVELTYLDSSDFDINVGNGYSLSHRVLKLSIKIGNVSQVEKH